MGPVPGSLRNVISSLSTSFCQRGRRAPWVPATPATSNPCDSELMESYQTRYRKMLSDHGYSATGAVPFTELKVVQLLGHIYEEAMRPNDTPASSSPSEEQMLAVRDGLAFSFAWSGASRSINSRELRQENFPLLESGAALRPFLHPAMLLMPGTLVSVTPDHLRKRGPERNHLDVVLPVPDFSSGPAMLLSPVIWLRFMLMLDARIPPMLAACL
ncbi:hypothetical protein WJX84_009466 [Apatococcus fuscideae]|uniref:Uncharacterized protein n=1 Tax=Apatococcus fuscideae TaxID=2026836 RepID=A0AAW1TJW3_9CHLO